MITVTSRDNPVLKSARKLRQTKGRGAAGAFICDGRKLIAEALNAGLTAETVFVAETALARGLSDGDTAFLETAGRLIPADRMICLGERQYRELAGTETPQPFTAVFRKPDYAPRAKEAWAAGPKGPSVLVLDRIGDPGNAGAMVRTARAAGFAEVWTVKGTVDLWSDKAIRAAAGSLFHMRVREGLAAENVLTDARAADARVYALGMSGENIYGTNLRGNVFLIVGNEGSGVRELFTKEADAVLAVPMADGTESLNAAAAAAVALYEKYRQENAL